MKKLWSTLLVLTLLFTFCFPSLVLASTAYTRIAGLTRYETSAQIATSGWSQSDYAVLCYGENYPDALASAPLAKKYNAPILLTMQNSLPDSTKQALTSLKVKTCIIVGGTGVISSNIDSQLQSMGISVNRVFGNDKYETAIAVAQQVTTTPSSIFVCNADDFGDALSVAPIASVQQSPIILVSSDSMPDSVKNYIASNKISKTYAIGYSDIILDSIINQFPNPERITGSDKYSRNVNINKYFNSTFASSGCGIATGEQFADALSSTAYLAKINEPLVLVNFNSPNDTRSYYQQRMGDQSKVFVFGGTGIVPDSVVSSLGNVNNNDSSTNTPSTDSGSTTIPSVPSTSTKMSDTDFQNYLNQNFGTLTIDGQSVRFNYNFSQINLFVDKSLLVSLNENDFITWENWIIVQKQNEMRSFFEKVNQSIIDNYPGKTFFGDVTYQHRYSFYPDAFPAKEISYSNGKWLVTHSIVTFYNMQAMGIFKQGVEIQ